ncbi:MAG TPA: sulfurtransferase TusA family protein [Spirochaetota bacterium]|nr:sulfurtransferase TusA family protein [Spirochaetota bacterium]OPZ35758.1 MAG: sulfur transfer protein SirA [Spirochaetes bacterium ADurb.BinA120]HNU90370.1 sulfurtransferase TusA family protein [Spirochaetota bacterium]HPI14998.1 sulfurtransferase TusA family protein [Spirochaetota bacterium]HPO46851.1 sulfurtransferase TusA family protein [Spirochaetota bacterium]
MDRAVIDTRGYTCPIPLAMVSRKMNGMDEGESAVIISDDAGFRRELEIWCAETGNAFLEHSIEGGVLRVTIGKGAGFRQEGAIGRIKFILLGVRLHVRKAVLSIVPIKKIRYLITFVSIPEGLRADRWLDSQGKRGHVALPVPSEITRRCGVVLGFSGREEAKRTYRLLMDNKFAPEDVYVMEDRGGLSKLMIE